MATVTPNFNWPVPTSTDLVKDGATAIEALGDSIDASLVDLKGGTTGQVLSKTSGTDMDFTWVTSDDANAIQNSIVDAKGDLISATANDTPARLAVGTNGQVLTADSTAATGLAWATASAGSAQVAGKNAIINGDFLINQRSFTSNTTSGTFNFDRWLQYNTGGSFTLTPQNFTPGAAPIAGYEGRTFLQAITASQSAAGDFAQIVQTIEDVTRYAGNTVTVSFFAKANTGTPKIALELQQVFGTGGSPSSIVNTVGGTVTLSTSWARYSLTVAVPSISGKTLGTTPNTSYLGVNLWTSAGSNFNSRASSIGIQNFTASVWGVQLEYGSSATYFTTATGTLQGELAACQRYYYNHISNGSLNTFGIGYYYSNTEVQSVISFPVTMRTAPTLVATSGSGYYSFERAGGSDGIDSWTIQRPSLSCSNIKNSTDVSGTGGEAGTLEVRNTSASISFSAEL